MTEERRYKNMSIEEINSKFYVSFTGTEDSGALKHLNGKLARLWQEVSSYYTTTEKELNHIKDKLSSFSDQLELNEQRIKWEYITQNKVLPVKERYSDAAKETAAFIQTRNEALLASLKVIKDELRYLGDELALWKNIKNNITFVAGRVDGAGFNVAVEAKLAAAEPTNIPPHIKSEEEQIEDKKDGVLF